METSQAAVETTAKSRPRELLVHSPLSGLLRILYTCKVLFADDESGWKSEQVRRQNGQRKLALK